MTINTNNTRNEYVASGGQTTFSYTFRIFDETDIDVYQTASGDTPADGDIITAYTVTGVGTVGGGTIVLDTGATANDKITIVYNPSLSRSVDYVNNGDFSPAAVNEDIDTNTNFIKRLYSMLRRIPKFSEAQQTVNDLTMQAPVAGEFLRWKSDASGIESVSLNTATAGSNAAAITYSNTVSGLTADDVQAAVDELKTEIDAITADPQDTADLITLTGVAANSTNLGDFTGGIITTNTTIKTALQDVETYVEAVESNIPTVVQGATAATCAAVSNVDSVTSASIIYSRVGSVVSFAFRATVDATAAGSTTTVFSIDPPVASNFGAATDCLGTVSSLYPAESGNCYADAASNKIYVSFNSDNTGNRPVYVSGLYYII